MNAKANPDFPGRENNELIAYVVVDCKASDSLVHEVVGYQEITKNEDEYPGQSGAQEEPELIGANQTFYVDEPPLLGGDGKYPQPLTYLAGGIGA